MADAPDVAAGDSDSVLEVDAVSVPLLTWIKVSIKQTENRSSTTVSLSDSYVVYRLACSVKEGGRAPDHFQYKSFLENLVTDEGADTPPVWRRYSEFSLLRDYLCVVYPAVVVPPLPEKRLSLAWQKIATDVNDPEFLERRRAGLELFLRRTCDHGKLSNDEIFVSFLSDETGWKEKTAATNFQAKADSKLKSMSAGFRLNTPDQRFDELKAFAIKLENHTGSLVKTRNRAVDSLYGVYRIHANYGRILSEWSGVENKQGDSAAAEAIQSAGHFFDAYAASVDTHLEHEDDLSDSLREYRAFADALRHVCRKRELVALDSEQAAAALDSRRLERDAAAEGKGEGVLGGLRARFRGAVAAEKAREERRKALDEAVLEAEEAAKARAREKETFESEFLKEAERFRARKLIDVKEMLMNYAAAQIRQCRADRTKWVGVKDSLEAM